MDAHLQCSITSADFEVSKTCANPRVLRGPSEHIRTGYSITMYSEVVQLGAILVKLKHPYCILVLVKDPFLGKA